MSSSALSAALASAALLWVLAAGCGDEVVTPLADAGIASCTNDDGCATEEHCDQGVCVPGTGNACDETPGSCGPGQVCQIVTDCGASRCHGNTCRPKPCTGSAECEGLWCDDGACRRPPACRQDANCPTDFVCRDDRCTYHPVPPCTSDRDCETPGTICVAGECGPPTSCTRTSDCPIEQRCLLGTCRDPCDANDDCGTLGTCDLDSGECDARCVGDFTCPSGAICESFMCVGAQCRADADCPQGPSGAECQGEENGRGRCVQILLCDGGGQCPQGYRCIQDTGRCERLPPCGSDRGCVNGYCEGGVCVPTTGCTTAPCGPGFDCVGGLCVPEVCRGDTDCPTGERCVGGTCALPGPATFVTQVRILTPAGVIAPQGLYAFTAVALDQSGAVVPGLSFDWASSSTGVAAIDARGIATGGAMAGTTFITAALSNGTQTITSAPVGLTNLGAPDPQRVRVSVVGEAGGAPIPGVLVDLVGAFGTASATTGPDGVALFPSIPDGAAFSVTAGHPNFDFVSVLELRAREVVLALPPVTRPSLAAGLRGSVDLSNVDALGDVSISLNGASFASPLFSFEPRQLFGGDLFTVTVPNPTGGTLRLPLPAGSTLGVRLFGAEIPLKDTFYARAATGPRAAWSFGGRTSLEGLLSSGGLSDLATAVLPFLQSFEHGVRPVIDVLALPTIADDDDLDGDGDTSESVPNWTRFANVALTPEVPQSLRYQVTAGALPLVEGGQANTLLLVAGAVLPGVGFVPLGLDGAQMGTGASTAFTTRIAPPHGGLEVGAYAVLAAALRLGAGGLPAAGATRLLLAPRLPEAVDFSDGWLDAPVGATWADPAREVAWSPVAGADLYRLTFRAEDGAWHVFTPPPESGGPLGVPLAPTGLVDRAALADAVTLDAIDLVDTASTATLFGPGGGRAAAFDEATRSFSRATVTR